MTVKQFQLDVTLAIPLSNLKPNPFRDFDNYPINEVKKDKLKITIQKTGHWDNEVACPVEDTDLEKVIECSKLGSREEQMKYIIDNKLFFYLMYGHHRLVAAQELGLKYFYIPVRDIGEEDQLSMMADENMEDWRSDPLVLLETYSQIYGFLAADIERFPNHAEYKKAGKDVFTSKQFATAKNKYDKTQAHDFGWRIVKKFMKGWTEATVVAAHRATGLMRAGVVDKSIYEGFSSVDIINNFSRLISAIYDTNIPPYFKRWFVEQCAAYVRKEGPSGKVLDLVTAQTRNGSDPVMYLKHEDPVPISTAVLKKLRSMLRDGVDMNKEGFDSEDMVSLIAQAKQDNDRYDRDELRKAQKAEEDAAREKAIEEKKAEMAEAGASEEEIDAMVQEMTPEVEQDSGEESGEGLVDDLDVDFSTTADTGESPDSIQSLTTTFFGTFDYGIGQAERLVDRVKEIDPEKYPEFQPLLEKCFEVFVTLYAEHKGWKPLKSELARIQKAA